LENKKIDQLKAGTILTYLSMSLGFIVSLVYTPVMIRLLGQSEYGLYNLSASVIAYLGILNFGFGSAYIRYFTKYKVKNDYQGIAKLNGMFLIIFSVIAIITLFAGFTISYYSDIIFGNKLSTEEIKTARVLLIILTINLAIRFPNLVFITYIRALERFVFQKTIDLIRIILNPFFILPLLFLGYGSIGMALGITFLSLLVELAHIYYAKKKLKIEFSLNTFDKILFKEMTIFSSYIFLNLLIDQINWNVDKFILGRFHGTVPVAIYSLAALFNAYYLQLSSAISSMFVPRVHKIISKPNYREEITKLFIKVGRIQFMVLSLFLTGFIIFGKPFIGWWAGENYIESYYIIIILIATVTIPIIQNLGIEIQRALNLHKFRSIIYLVIALINIGITIPLVIKYQGIGAALGTAFALLVGNGIIMNIYYHKKVGLDILLFWKEIFSILPSFLLPVLLAYLYTTFVDIYNIYYFILGIAIYAIAFATSLWLFGMNKFEKSLISKPLIGIINRIK